MMSWDRMGGYETQHTLGAPATQKKGPTLLMSSGGVVGDMLPKVPHKVWRHLRARAALQHE